MLVVMNATAASGVAADLGFGVKVGVLLPIAVGLLVVGLLVLGAGTTMFVFGLRAAGRTPPALDAPPADGTGDRTATLNTAAFSQVWLISAAQLPLNDRDDGFKLKQIVVNATPSVPEPATWAMLIMGFGAIGASLRRRAARAGTRVVTA